MQKKQAYVTDDVYTYEENMMNPLQSRIQRCLEGVWSKCIRKDMQVFFYRIEKNKPAS